MRDPSSSVSGAGGGPGGPIGGGGRGEPVGPGAPGPGRSGPAGRPVPLPARTAPVRTAIALIIVMGVLALSGLVGLLLDLVGSSPLDAVPADPGSDRAGLTVFAGAVVLLVLVNVGLWIAALVLAILVTVRARRGSRLFHGGVLALAPIVLGLMLGLELTGDPSMFPDALLVLARILDIAGTLLVAGLRVASIVLLVLGLRQVRQERGADRVTARP